ncbi:MAG: FkbM family methyltransferase [Pseudomonadota bacterium]
MRARAAMFDTTNEQYLISSGTERFIVSTDDSIIARKLYSERQFDLDKFYLASQLTKFSATESTFIDVGANIGSICLPLLKRKEVNHAIAIEPEGQNFRLLRANAILNEVDARLTALNVAVCESDGEDLVLELSNDNHGDHRIRVSRSAGNFDEPNRAECHVQGVSLDTLLSEHAPKSLETQDRSTFLWIDTQGYEGAVLKGATRTLSVGHPLVMEFWPYGLKRSGGYNDLKSALGTSSYKWVFDLSETAPAARTLSDETLDAIYSRLGEAWPFTDLLLTSDP